MVAPVDQFSFELVAQKGKARAGVFHTPHGSVETPIFMPVGTLGTVKALDEKDIAQTHAQIILGNTYHLYLHPGLEVLESMGGMHGLSGWNKPILTDSGGYQVFSLTKTGSVKISEEGVRFTSHRDGSHHFFSPARAIEIQRYIGADIIMAFDEAIPDSASVRYASQSVDRTTRWAAACMEAWERTQRRSIFGRYQALFGIVQGSLHRHLREKSAQEITSMGFDGIAVGGETIGYNMAATTEIMGWIETLLPKHKPRYAMGLGRDPQNIIDAVIAGFDMFDCVGPSRLARNGSLYNGAIDFSQSPPVFISPYKKGRLQIANAEFKHDSQPIQTDCDCHTCLSGYSRAYLRHLYKTKELTYYRLATIHNIRFFIRLAESMRKWVVTTK